MHVAEIWRYPVKSMAGERLQTEQVHGDGIRGDRIVHTVDARGQLVTARTKPGLLALHGTLGPDDEPLVDGRPWQSAPVAEAVEAVAGSGTRLVRHDSIDRFDVLPLSIVSDGAVRALAVDRRRLRPNIVVGGVDGLAERLWPGRRLRLGTIVLEVVKLRSRCVMTTYDPDTQVHDVSVLRRIVEEFDGRMALDCAVIKPGGWQSATRYPSWVREPGARTAGYTRKGQ